jgi:hypothetical protein
MSFQSGHDAGQRLLLIAGIDRKIIQREGKGLFDTSEKWLAAET